MDPEIERMNRESQYLDDDDDILNQDPSKLEDEEDEEDHGKDENVEEDEADVEEDEADVEEDEADDEDADDEDADEDDGEPAKAAKKGEDEDADEKGIMLPKKRYDSVKKRLDEVTAELERMRSKESTKATQADAGKLTEKLEDVSTKLTEALATGDVDAANKLRVEERQLIEQTFELRARDVALREVENARFQDFIGQVEADYPELDQNSGVFSKEANGEVMELLESFEMRGYRPVDALKKALGYVFPDGPTIETETAADEATPPDTGHKRKSEAKRRNARHLKRQPPRTEGRGVDSDKGGPREKLNLAELSEEEFDKLELDSEEMKRARGDYRI